MNTDYKDMLCELSAAGVEFLVVGAYALAAHGLPRSTGDFDIWIRPDETNAPRVMQALVAFGAPLFGLTVEDVAKPGVILQIGVVPARIDIITRIDGVEFAAAWENRVTATLHGVAVPVIGRAELIQNKRAAGRPKDLVDVAALTKEPDR